MRTVAARRLDGMDAWFEPDPPRTTSAEEARAPSAPGYTAFDLWAKTTTVTSGRLSAPVPPHGAVLFRVRPTVAV